MTPETPKNIALPNEIERRQIFYWLKRVSSYTAWNRIMGFYKVCTDKMEKILSAEECQSEQAAQKLANNSIHTQRLVNLLKSISLYERALSRLKTGNKRVFRYENDAGFVLADRSFSGWSDIRSRQDQGENYFEPQEIPFFDELESARNDADVAWGECARYILEGRYCDDPAPVMYGHPMETESMVFPEPLPELPIIREECFVETGSIVPCSGIWEPVHVEKTKGFVGMFQRPIPVSSGDYAIAGCMNYLHGGSLAPKIKVDAPEDILQLTTTWRLLWRDDRYEDGTIPEEEQFYVFQEPEADRRTRKTTLLVNNEVPVISTDEFLITARSGTPAPRAGFWSVQETQYTSVEMAQGSILPQHEGRDVTWIWHYS